MNFNIIAAVTKTLRGIGYENGLPWPRIKADMIFFRDLTKKTENPNKKNAVIMGRKTWDSLPKPLPGRKNIVISRSQSRLNNSHIIARSLDEAIRFCGNDIETTYVVGGRQIYEKAIKHKKCDKLYITEIDTEYHSDTFFPDIPRNYIITNSKKMTDGVELKTYKNVQDEDSEECQYLSLVDDILKRGEYKKGRNGNVYSLFGEQHLFDLNEGFPLLTTKKMFFKGISEELLFFLRGETDAAKLSEKGVKIWEKNTTREFLDSRGLKHYEVGDIGPMYGFQMRNFGSDYGGKYFNHIGMGYDQLWNLVDELKKNPNSRRLLMTTFDPSKIAESVLAPCHGLSIQFNVRNGNFLDCKMYQRSVDVALGYPFNISSYSLLVHLICHVSGYLPGKLTMTLGDTHIYENHVDHIKKQITRTPYKFPNLKIDKVFDHENASTGEKIDFLTNLKSEDFEIENYKFHPALKFEMVS
jgi:dihydrofolate reductase/thymidylate synthase